MSSSGGFAPGQFNEPRSAPRPPTDRPRLNITPAIQGLPGNLQNMSLNSPAPSMRSASAASTNYSGSVSSAVPLTNTASNTDTSGVSIIKEGFATVKDGKTFLNPWRQKYMVLRKDVLDFHKARDGKVSYKIVLKDVVGVSRVEAAGVIFEIKRYSDGTSNNPGDDSDGVRSLKIKVESDDELYQWVDFIYARCPGMGGVSNPTNFAHAVHVGFDNTTGKFVGLPPEWSKLLNSSAITKEDYERNPQAVFEVLEFYSDIIKRAEHPEAYSSLTPTPPVTNNNNKQLGYGGGGMSVAGPRQPPNAGQRNPSSNYGGSQQQGGMAPVSGSQEQQLQQMRAMASQFKTDKSQQQQQPSREEQYQREMQQARERERREAEERERRELAEYNASIPKTRPPMAQQEIGGGGYSSPSSSDRYNPTRAAPPAPGGSRQPQTAGSLRSQREAPRAPTRPNPPSSQSSSSSISREQQLREREQREREQGRSSPRNNENQRQDPRYQNAQQSQSSRHQNGQPQGSTTPRGEPASQAAPKPLNVTKQPQTANGIKQNDAVKAAEAALTSKAPPTQREKDVRMSQMSEADVMLKLKEIVSKDDPSMSYTKQKKIGQGASGSVYVAKVRSDAISPVAREVLRTQGPKAQVAIKQMDLAHQPRKELIVNEIIVMKDSKHRNIVNFLDAFLRNNSSELWVVMEFMEGGALTDVIDANQGGGITEEQIACICREVRPTFSPLSLEHLLILSRPV